MIIFSETTGPIGTKLCMMMFVRSFTEISIWFGPSDEHGCYGNFFFLKFWLAKNKKNKNLPWNLVHLFVRLSIPHFILIQMAAMHNHFLFLISSWYRWLQCTIIFSEWLKLQKSFPLKVAVEMITPEWKKCSKSKIELSLPLMIPDFVYKSKMIS